MRKLAKLTVLCFALSCAITVPAFSQVKKTKKTIRGEALLPRPLSNKAFNTLFSGVFSANLSYNIGFNNFNTGIVYGIMQSQIFPKFQSDPHAIQTVHTVGVKFGYDIYPSKAKLASQKGSFFVCTPFINPSFAEIDYSRLKCLSGEPSGKKNATWGLNGGINFTMMFNEYDGVGFTLGYTYLNHEFNPDPLCLSQYYPNIPDSDKHGLSQYFVYGFNVVFDLVKREGEDE